MYIYGRKICSEAHVGADCMGRVRSKVNRGSGLVPTDGWLNEPEVFIYQLVDEIDTRFQGLNTCFEAQQLNGTMVHCT